MMVDSFYHASYVSTSCIGDLSPIPTSVSPGHVRCDSLSLNDYHNIWGALPTSPSLQVNKLVLPLWANRFFPILAYISHDSSGQFHSTLMFPQTVLIVGTKKSNSPSPLRTMGLYSSTIALINKFVRERIKEQERALLEDGNKEERLNIIEYVSKFLSTRLPKEANDTQKSTLFTLFSQCSYCNFFLSDICVSPPFLWEPYFSYILPPLHILIPHLYLPNFS